VKPVGWEGAGARRSVDWGGGSGSEEKEEKSSHGRSSTSRALVETHRHRAPHAPLPNGVIQACNALPKSCVSSQSFDTPLLLRLIPRGGVSRWECTLVLWAEATVAFVAHRWAEREAATTQRR